MVGKKINEDDLADFLNEKGLAILDVNTMAIIQPGGYSIGENWVVFDAN